MKGIENVMKYHVFVIGFWLRCSIIVLVDTSINNSMQAWIKWARKIDIGKRRASEKRENQYECSNI